MDIYSYAAAVEPLVVRDRFKRASGPDIAPKKTVLVYLCCLSPPGGSGLRHSSEAIQLVSNSSVLMRGRAVSKLLGLYIL